MSNRQSYDLKGSPSSSLPKDPHDSLPQTSEKKKFEEDIREDINKHQVVSETSGNDVSEISKEEAQEIKNEENKDSESQDDVEESVITKIASDMVSDAFVDPRSPSMYLQRTPLLDAISEEGKSQVDCESTPLRETTKTNQADQLRRRVLVYKHINQHELVEDVENNLKPELDLQSPSITQGFSLPFKDTEEEVNDENRIPEDSPIPKSPKKSKLIDPVATSDMSLLANELDNLALQTPIAVREKQSC